MTVPLQAPLVLITVPFEERRVVVLKFEVPVPLWVRLPVRVSVDPPTIAPELFKVVSRTAVEAAKFSVPLFVKVVMVVEANEFVVNVPLFVTVVTDIFAKVFAVMVPELVKSFKDDIDVSELMFKVPALLK